ncbi:MAG: hypothetical protein J6S67_25225 [Methanobrevibacter sp.]|nr:hypothetical protein [Methanobrevibacter sp.]
MQKWKRNYILSVQTGDNTYVDIVPPLTITFQITRNTNASANTGRITIYNLSETTRLKIFKDQYDTKLYKGVELRAGYGDDKETLPLIFKGNIRRAYSERSGVDYHTVIDAYDGGFAFSMGKTDHNFAEGTPDYQILTTLVKDLPGTDLGAIGGFTGKLSRGNAISGPTVQQIQSLIDKEDSFFIDNEKAYVLKQNECINGNVNVVDSDVGLLGTPLKEGSYLTFKMIFEPRLQIGQRLTLNSSTESLFNGTYQVIGLTHTGTISDSVGGNCITTVSCFYGTKPLRVIK